MIARGWFGICDSTTGMPVPAPKILPGAFVEISGCVDFAALDETGFHRVVGFEHNGME